MDELSGALTTVSVPPPLVPIFLRAQEYVARYFRDRVEDPQHSTISISGERYVLVRAASLSVEFFDLVLSLYRDHGPEQARSVANNLLFDLAHSIGRADARAFHARMGVTDPIERLSAGPVHFSFAGWAYVRILPESSPSPDENYCLLYDHPFAFESDAWVRRGRRSDFPVCIMNAGYSSGWCEESFGLPLVSAEVECIARGDPQCRFIMAPPGRIEGHLARYFERTKPSSTKHWWPGRATEVAVPEFFQRKRLEDELRESHAQLERRVRERTEELASANAALQAEIAERKRAEAERQKMEARMLQAQKLESLGLLAGGIAHDFNNLLVGVLGNVGIARGEVGPDSPSQETLRQIELAATRAADLTRQLLAYSGRGRFVLERIDLTRLVEEMAGLLSTALSRKAVVRLLLARGLPPVEADATQIRQIVMNLITNASDALGDGAGEIVVRTGRARAGRAQFPYSFLEDPSPGARQVFFQVKDTGCGMDRATRDRIFEPFFTTKSMGRGLGLAAALGIVRAHRGAIDVRSALGRGTTVRVVFPALAEGAVPAAPPGAALPADGGGEGGPALVLVVDDDVGARTVAARVLMQQGCHVLTAKDGEEAIGIFRKRGTDVDLVLLDLTMPGLGGAETRAEMRKIRPSVCVVLSSGYDEEDLSLRLANDPPAGFLHKPYRMEDLIARVQEALRTRPGSP